MVPGHADRAPVQANGSPNDHREEHEEMYVNESGTAAAQKPARELVEGDVILAGGARVRIDVVDLTRTDRNGWVEVEVSDTSSRCSHDMPPSLTFRPGERVTVIGHDAA